MTTHVTIPKIRSRHRSAERRLIVGALERNGWNVGATARDLDVPDSGLRAILKAHGLDDNALSQHGADVLDSGRHHDTAGNMNALATFAVSTET